MAYPVDAGIRITAVFRQVSKVGNWKTCGHHTGTDWACQTGDPVYAVVDGDVRYRNYGPAFGLTVAVSPDGPGEWQYSHLSRAVPNGTRVKAGDIVGWAGTSGDVPPHLHLEWHPNHKNVWRCGIQADPVPEIARIGRETWRFGKGHKVYLSKLRFGGHESNPDGTSDSITALQEMLNRHTLRGGSNLPLVGKYGPDTDAEVIKCQTQCGFGADKPGTSFVGPAQAAHLIAATEAPYEVVDDRPKDGGGGGGSWWLSQAGYQLFAEVNALFPGRDRRTDGTIGDAAHTTGEHVPDKATGVVRAVDIDADLNGDPGASWVLADILRQTGKTDPRIWYIIHDGKITSGTNKDQWWMWRPYTGSNPHTSHVHVSFHPAGDKDPGGFGLAEAWKARTGPEKPKPGKARPVRFLTFNWPPRYKVGGKAADRALWAELAAQADVIGLQEASWVPGVITDPEWVFHNPVGGDGKPVGQVLAWRKARFDTLDAGLTIMSPATRVQEEAAGPTVHREKNIVWADLRDQVTGEVWNPAVAHLVPSKHLGGAALRLWKQQLDALVAWIGRQGDRCVLLGDFNCPAGHADVAPLRKAATIRSAVSHGKRDIDWVVVKNTGVLEVGAAKALPNRGQSDHKPVTAVVTDLAGRPEDPDKPDDPKEKPVTRAEYEHLQARVVKVEAAVATLAGQTGNDLRGLRDTLTGLASDIEPALQAPGRVAVALRSAAEIIDG